MDFLHRHFPSAACCFALAAMFISVTARGAVDLNNDGIPDVWALVYDAGTLAPGNDTDGDGQSNASEAAAGTNPFVPGSAVRIDNITVDGGAGQLTASTERGKRYQVQSSPSLESPNWQDEGSPTIAQYDHTTFAISVPTASQKFFHVVVRDADSDGDGVSDWEEIQVGFDPNNSHSKGLSQPDDLTALTQALLATNVITVTAVDASATEPASGVAALEVGSFLIVRAGNINPITVTYTLGGGAVAGSDFAPLSGTVTLPLGANSAVVTVTPLADNNIESPEAVILTISASPRYTIGAPGVAAVLIHDNVTANGTGLNAQFWNEVASGTNQISPTNPAKFAGNPAVSRIDATIDFDWDASTTQGVGSPAVGVTTDYFSSRWSGEVLSQYSQVYTFSFDVNLAGRVWVNGQLLINNWPPNAVASGTFTGTIELEAGVRYPIVVEQYETTGTSRAHLRWESLNQLLQVIPQNRLFANTAPQILSPTNVLLIQNGPPYTYQIVASGRPLSYSAANLPPGWTINPTTGVISGSPTDAGTWEIPVTATNGIGTGAAIVSLQILATGGGVNRDLWTGVPGSAVSSIPLGNTPTTTTAVAPLEVAQSAPDMDDFGARLRGYVTAPLTGAYKFWLTASDSAELYISNDDEPINAFKRAAVSAPTGYRDWSNANTGRTALLALEAGRRYYVEIRHKAGIGSDHVSVGWLKPGEGGPDPANAAAPGEVVPAYVLSPFIPPTPVSGASTLYTTSMSSQSGALTSGYGSASLQLSADESQAILRFSYANLSTPVSGEHIHSDTHGGAIIFDIDVVPPNADGSVTWDIVGVGAVSAADIVNVIKSGQAYLNIHTANYPAGEIRGNFRFQPASQSFTPPSDPPTWNDDSSDANAAARFLIQSTFGVHGADADVDGTPDAIEQVQSLGYGGWIADQFTKAPTSHYDYVFANRNQTDANASTYPSRLTFNAWWRNSVTAPDQLRQRVAFALSEILVVSEAGVLTDRADTLSDFYDTLAQHALGTDLVPGVPPAQQVRGNFRDLLEAVSLHPAMGRYLDMLRNDKPDKTKGRIPNENYAREVLQLFSIGLNRMHPDGSLMLSSKGELIPTYDQNAIIGFAHAFTGWDYNYSGPYRTALNAPSNWIDPMREVPVRHFTGQKRLLNNVLLPGLPMVAGQPLDPYAAHTSAQYNDPLYQALPGQELDATHDAIFNHPNCAPFVCRQLIQRLVTSTPSRGYIYRVVQKFNDNGSGVRGDMKAVIKAILLDFEARSPQLLTQQGYGKQREPVVRITGAARGLPAPPPVSGTFTQGQSGAALNLITVTTSAPHLYTTGTSAFLDFSNGTPSDPDDAAYAVTVISPTQFTARALTSEGASYSQSANVITLTTNGHTFTVGNIVYIDFVSGSPSSPPDGLYTVASVTTDEFQFTVRPISSVSGSYNQVGNNVTVTTSGHTFTVGASVYIDFTSGSPDLAADGTYTVATVSADGLQFTVVVADAVSRTGNAIATPSADAINRTGGSNSAFATKSSYALQRTGNVAVNYSDWGMDSTETDLNQTPLRSPTVFNFFEPDYQFPGLLAQAGLITPEFQITSDTSVIRQANFLYNGLFTDSLGQSGLSSFKAGARDIFVDLRPWMGNNPANGLPWAHNNNLNALIDKLNTLLMGGQLPVAAKTIIKNYAQTLAYTTPTTTQLRDRVRAVVHLMVTSPDFTIQK